MVACVRWRGVEHTRPHEATESAIETSSPLPFLLSCLQVWSNPPKSFTLASNLSHSSALADSPKCPPRHLSGSVVRVTIHNRGGRHGAKTDLATSGTREPCNGPAGASTLGSTGDERDVLLHQMIVALFPPRAPLQSMNAHELRDMRDLGFLICRISWLPLAIPSLPKAPSIRCGPSLTAAIVDSQTSWTVVL